MSVSKNFWHNAILPIDSTISQVIDNLNKVAIKIVMVINKDGVLEGTISDGDLRRGLLKGLNMNSSINSIIHHNALVVPPEMERSLVLQLMTVNKIQQIPIIDEYHHIIGLHLWDDIAIQAQRSNLMVIMAGGMGKRLRPDTENCPKPLLKISGKPILEHIIERAKMEGFTNFVIAIHYIGNMNEEYYGNGDSLGVKINYLREESPLGTAGALSLIQSSPDKPFIVTNGDVITDIKFGELLDFHAKHEATGTMAVRQHEWEHPFGVVETQGVEIIGFKEKPIALSHINAGIYALNPSVLDALLDNSHCDMPTLFERLKTNSNRIVAYPMHEPWLDVGMPEDLETARSNSLKGSF